MKQKTQYYKGQLDVLHTLLYTYIYKLHNVCFHIHLKSDLSNRKNIQSYILLMSFPLSLPFCFLIAHLITDNSLV